MTVVRPVSAVVVLFPLLHFVCTPRGHEVKRPEDIVGAVGSIELMVAMALRL
ncbi:MAG: hypothetical protein ACYS17_04610 [Planctomycetota bacterium]